MFKTRLLSGIVLLILIISTGILGGPVFGLFVAAISLIAFFEFMNLVSMKKSIYLIAGIAAALGYFALVYFEKTNFADAAAVVTLLLFMAIYVITYPKFESQQVFAAFTGFVYSVLLLSYLYRVRALDGGVYLLWIVFIGSWGSDTCAYCVGMLFGKHKAFPKLSPKKSVEGCIGGAVGAALICTIYAICLNRFTDKNVSVLLFSMIGLCASVVSQIGDLAASAMKRNFGIKDYGKLIPGHGGILDRFDSIIFTAPIVYCLAQFM